jgi:plasmid stability protein
VPQLTVRNIDEALYARLKDRASSNHRSLEAEVRAILDQQLRLDRTAVVRRANEFRRRLVGRHTGDATAEIRADRDR